MSKIEVLGPQDEQIYIEFSTERLAGLRLDYPTILATLAGAKHHPARRRHPDRRGARVPARFRRVR